MIDKASFMAASVFPSKLLKTNVIEEGKIIPYHIQLYPTNNCNMNCPFCSCSEVDRKQQLTLEQIIELIDEAKELGTKAVTISGGGEPLIHPEIEDIVKYIHNSGMEIGLVSNGLLLAKPTKEFWDCITWCRISSGDHRNFPMTYQNILLEAVSKGNNVDWAFSHVLYGEPNLDTILGLINFSNENNFTHIRIVDDILNPSNSSMDRVRLAVDGAGIDESKVIYQGRKEFTAGVKDCFVSLLRPVIAADGYIYPCCVHENEHILINRGGSIISTPIKDVKVGDYCYNSKERKGKVINKLIKNVEHPIKITLRGGRSIIVSKDHIMFKGINFKPITAGELKIGDKLPILIETPTNNTEVDLSLLARLLGYYTAEGWSNEDITLMIGKEDIIKTDLFKVLDSLGISYRINIRETGLQIGLRLKTITRETRKNIKDCGSKAINKRVPNVILNSSEITKLNYLWALICGDGCINYRKNSNSFEIKIRTISRELVNSLSYLCSSIGINYSIGFNKREGESIICGRKVNINNIYTFTISTYETLKKFEIFGLKLWDVKHKRSKSLRFENKGNFNFVPIMKIESEKSGIFYDLQVEDTNTFLVNGILVHNCGSQYSIKGEEKGLNPKFSMGRIEDFKQTFSEQKMFNGSVCYKCFYSNYNDALGILKSDLKHINFI